MRAPREGGAPRHPIPLPLPLAESALLTGLWCVSTSVNGAAASAAATRNYRVAYTNPALGVRVYDLAGLAQPTDYSAPDYFKITNGTARPLPQSSMVTTPSPTPQPTHPLFYTL